MRIYIYLIILVCFPLFAKGQEFFLHNEPASTIPKGVLGVSAFRESFSEINTQRNMLAIRLKYGLTPRLSVYLTATGSNHHGDRLPEDFINHTHVGSQTFFFTQPIKKGVSYPNKFSGFHAYAKYRFLSVDGKNKHYRMALYGEWSNLDNAHDEAEPNLLDDNNGYGGGIITTYLKNRLAISFSTGLIIPGDYEESLTLDELNSAPTATLIKYGRAVIYNLSFGYLIYPKEYKNYSQTNWNVYLEFNGKAYEKARIYQNNEELATQSNAHKSGHYVEVHPGIQKIINSKLQIDLSVGFNIINKSYARFYPLYMIGIQRYIFFNKK
ncbi:MAG: hypothetical protein ACJAUV_001970 [Flavobacteriales bacterium]|jgi:hypothetical protein